MLVLIRQILSRKRQKTQSTVARSLQTVERIAAESSVAFYTDCRVSVARVTCWIRDLSHVYCNAHDKNL